MKHIYFILSFFYIHAAFSASCSSSDPATDYPILPKKSLAALCRTAIAANHDQAALCIEKLGYDYPVAQEIFALHLNNALLNRISMQHRLLGKAGLNDPSECTAISFSGAEKNHILTRHTIHRDHQIEILWDVPTKECAYRQDDALVAWCTDITASVSHTGGVAVDDQGRRRRTPVHSLLHIHHIKTATSLDIPLEFILSSNVVFNADGSCIACADRTNIFVWDTQTGSCLKTIDSNSDLCYIRKIAFSPDGSIAAIIGQSIRVWNSQTGDYLYELKIDPTGDYMCSLAFSDDGSHIVAGILKKDGPLIRVPCRFQIWDTSTRACINTSEYPYTSDQGADPTCNLSTIAFGRGASTIATASRDGAVNLWTGFQSDLLKISDPEEKEFLLKAAKDWLAHKVHYVPSTDSVYQKLIATYTYLDNKQLFHTIEPDILAHLVYRHQRYGVQPSGSSCSSAK